MADFYVGSDGEAHRGGKKTGRVAAVKELVNRAKTLTGNLKKTDNVPDVDFYVSSEGEARPGAKKKLAKGAAPAPGKA